MIRYLAAFAIMLSGCADKSSIGVNGRTAVRCICPKFTSKLSIRVDELNATHAAIKWSDVAKIEAFLRAKKSFNDSVESLNRDRKEK